MSTGWYFPCIRLHWLTTARAFDHQFLVEERRKLVQERIRFAQRLTAHLKLYFPQVLGWFGEISSQIAGDFLERWPTLERLQKVKPHHGPTFFRGTQ